ncbi:hypothetical protein HK104_005461 [Borealophlyctis nickersoniae]|nr:hypothetical protein HK104_005461 [Borealophlyctis nickersoniae]
MGTNLPLSLNYQFAANSTAFYAYPAGGLFYVTDSSTYNTSLGLNSMHRVLVDPAGWDQNRTIGFLMQSKTLWVADGREKVNLQYIDDVGRAWWQDAKYGGLLYVACWPVWRGLPATAAKAGEDPLGMVFVALSPYRLDALLSQIRISDNAVISLWEDDGEMIAASVPNGTIVPTAALRGVVHYFAHNTTNSLIVRTANNLLSQYKSYNAIPDNLETSFESESGEILVNVRLITSFQNLKWILVLSVPKNDFVGTLASTQKSVIGAVSGTAVGMVLMSALMAYALVHPIRRLSATMVQAAAFDFSAIRDGYLTKQSIFEPLEIAHCKAVFNTMLTRFAAAIQANKSLVKANAASTSAAATSQPHVQTKTR